MFIHQHPYPPFIPKHATKLIVGTLPPPRFTTGQLYPEDVDFCYGSKYGLLWPVLDAIFDIGLEYAHTPGSVAQRKEFLATRGIGICDMVECCERERMTASDLDMKNIVLRDLTGILKRHPGISTLLFMGGNSKNGPEYLFRRHLREQGLNLKEVDSGPPRMHRFNLGVRKLRTVTLISPSSAANRSIGANPDFKRLRSGNPKFSTMDYRVLQYTPFFKE